MKKFSVRWFDAKRVVKKSKAGCIWFLIASAFGARAFADEAQFSMNPSPQESILLESFSQALAFIADPEHSEPLTPQSQYWVDGLTQRGLSSHFIANRVKKLQQSGSWQQHLTLHRFLPVSTPLSPFLAPLARQNRQADSSQPLPYPIALHTTHIAVDEDYDDVLNDNLFVYSVVSYQDLSWGKVTSIYANLDEGTEAIFLPDDRPLFDPRGRFHTLESPLTIDYGIVESDTDDIEELSRLSKAIIDLAAAALVITSPDHGVSALRVRSETQNLIRMLISMDDADRLVTSSLVFDAQSIADLLGQDSYTDWEQSFSGTRLNSDFSYRLGFRLMRRMD